MKRIMRRILPLLIVLVLSLTWLVGMAQGNQTGLLGKDLELEQLILEMDILDENGYYYSREEVAAYLYQYGTLPINFITKQEARSLGWNGGSVERYLQDAAIGGDRYGDYEEVLPRRKGTKFFECDIDTHGQKSRGAKRIIFSNDGRIYYTQDHYSSFIQLIGEED